MKPDAALAGVCICMFCFSARQPLKSKALTDLYFYLPDDLEIVLWAESSMYYNPANIDVDAPGRARLTDAVNYRYCMVPGILALLVTWIGAWMCSRNIMKEKETGKMEQINSTLSNLVL